MYTLNITVTQLYSNNINLHINIYQYYLIRITIIIYKCKNKHYSEINCVNISYIFFAFL